MFLFSKKFYTSFTHIYIHCDILSIHLEITEVRSKRRVYFYCQTLLFQKSNVLKERKLNRFVTFILFTARIKSHLMGQQNAWTL